MPEKIYDYYILIYKPEHSRAYQTGYVLEQVLVAESHLKRFLTQDEEVRHINGNPQDNRPENLEIISMSYGYRSQRVQYDGEFQQPTQNKTFMPCKFQKPCWKEIRAPLARKYKVYLPYVCSFQSSGDVYECSHHWNYKMKELKENEK